MDIYNVNFTIDTSYCHIWQYDNAENLSALLTAEESFSTNYISEFWENWVRDVFTIKTANSFGLELWGKNLSVSRPSWDNNGNIEPFDDEMYRLLLLDRVSKFFMRGSVPEINKYISFVFPDKPIFVYDGLDMTITIFMYFDATAKDLAVMQSPGFIPVPAGVEVKYYVATPDTIFGFYGSQLSGFSAPFANFN